MDTVVIGSSDSDDQPLIQKAKPSANKTAPAGAKGGVKRHPRPQRRAKESSEDAESSSGSEVSSDEAPIARKATKTTKTPPKKGKQLAPARKRSKVRALSCRGLEWRGFGPNATVPRRGRPRLRTRVQRVRCTRASWQPLMDGGLLWQGPRKIGGSHLEWQDADYDDSDDQGALPAA
jgi:hypothetical protein